MILAADLWRFAFAAWLLVVPTALYLFARVVEALYERRRRLADDDARRARLREAYRTTPDCRTLLQAMNDHEKEAHRG